MTNFLQIVEKVDDGGLLRVRFANPNGTGDIYAWYKNTGILYKVNNQNGYEAYSIITDNTSGLERVGQTQEYGFNVDDYGQIEIILQPYQTNASMLGLSVSATVPASDSYGSALGFSIQRPPPVLGQGQNYTPFGSTPSQYAGAVVGERPDILRPPAQSLGIGIPFSQDYLAQFITSTTTTGDTSVVTGGGNPPPQDNTTNTPVPDASKELLSMPNIDIVIKDEIERITLELVEDVKEFLISDTVNYKSIDFFPDVEIVKSKNANVSKDMFSELVKYVMENIIGLSKPNSPTYNYAKFLTYFDVGYNKDGDPVLTFNLKNLDNFNLSSVRIRNVSKGI